MRYLIPLFFLLTLSCEPRNKEKLKKTEEIKSIKPTTETKDTLYHKSKLNIYDSHLYFEFEITNIELKEKPNYFFYSEEKYSKPVKQSGFQPTLNFKIKNPYDVEYDVPIPNYYYIRSESSYFTNLPDVNYDKDDRYHYYFTDQLNDKNGKMIIARKVTGGKLISFKPSETKEFQVAFKSITNELTHLKFGGIHTEFQSYNPRTNSSNIKEVWFNIDFSLRKVTGKSTVGGFKTY